MLKFQAIQFKTFLRIIGGLFGITIVSSHAPFIFSFFEKSADGDMISVFLVVGLLFFFSFLTFHFARGTIIPSFVMAILVGLAANDFFHPIIEHREVLSTIVSLSATIILFSGGLETSFLNFKKIFGKIFSLSIPGLVITAFLFSVILSVLNIKLGASLSVATILLLGAVLSSTDPAAIIPVIKNLRFKNREIKDLIISESAVTDVTGTLLTVLFLSFVTSGTTFNDITSAYSSLFTAYTGTLFLKEILFGTILGTIGYGLLELLSLIKEKQGEEFEVDAIFILCVPIMIFAFAASLGGSGYLAAFVAGLLYSSTEKLHESEEYFNHTIEGILKPSIFLLLGALVDINDMIEYAGIGIVIAFIFMFIIRPFAVFISLSPWNKSFVPGNWRELLFLSFIRETGAIPAVLLVVIASIQLPNTQGLVPIGMWVILATLIIEPPLTPKIAKALQVAEDMTETRTVNSTHQGQIAMLGSRGHSFIERLPKVIEWSARHNITKIILLHCPEDNYSDEFAEKIKNMATREFSTIQNNFDDESIRSMKFRCIVSRGRLDENIRHIASQEKNLSVIFVGRKILDYRLEEIKNMPIPLYFLD